MTPNFMEINYRVFHKPSFKKLKLEGKPKKNKKIAIKKTKTWYIKS
jgi:hypothetical protein